VRNLNIFIAIVHPDNNNRSIKTVTTNLKSNGWVVSSSDVSYPDLGDSIAGSCWLILGIHLSCAASVEPLLLKHPPAIPSRSLAGFIWEPFNQPEHSISLARDNPNFANQDGPKMTITLPKSTTHNPNTVMLKYHIHRAGSYESILVGSDVISLMAFALHSMPAQIKTSSRHTLESNSTTMVTLTFAPSHHSNLFVATGSLTNCHTASHNHHINSVSTL
jgi:hypothetical protein